MKMRWSTGIFLTIVAWILAVLDIIFKGDGFFIYIAIIATIILFYNILRLAFHKYWDKAMDKLDDWEKKGNKENNDLEP